MRSDPEKGGRYPEGRNSEGYADPTYYGGTAFERRRAWKEALQTAEKASETDELRRKVKSLGRQLAKAKARRDMYADRCAAWERALADLDELYTRQLNAKTDSDLDELQSSATAYGLAVACAVLRRRVEGTYEGDPRKIARGLLNHNVKPARAQKPVEERK